MTPTNVEEDGRRWSRRRLLVGGLATAAVVPVVLPGGPLPALYDLVAGAPADGPRSVASAVAASGLPRLPGRGAPSVTRVAYRQNAHPEPLEPFRDALPIPRTVRPDHTGEVTVRMRVARVRMHSQLPTTTVWGFDGTVPGPTIEVRADRRTRVRWVNELSGKMPLVAVAPMIAEADPPLWDRPGRDGAPELVDVSNLPPWTVVHLHGAETGMGNDGWPEAGIPPGDVQVVEYANDQRATLLWYHDHAMPISRWNTIAGLSGLYVIRDRAEEQLGLPSGKHEVPLVLCDRNFDLDAAGKLTGTQLYKTVMYTMEPELQATSFSGPFTTVNGIIWPHLDVEPRWYRLRIANVSNVRPYVLRLTFSDGTPVPAGVVKLVGTDGGLLSAPVAIDGALPVAAAERVDVLVDFGALRGKRVRLVNEDYDPGPWPQVMEFRVSGRGGAAYAPPKKLDRAFPEPAAAAVAAAPERMIMFPPLGTGQIEQWEMRAVPAPPGPFPIDGVVQVRGQDGTVRTYERTARHFNDPVSFMAATGSWERWTWMNLDVAGWPHPQHIHATHFRVTQRHHYDVAEKFEFILDGQGRTVGGGTTAPLEFASVGEVTPVEGGWKDVVQVNNAEAVTVAARFDHSGRFLHHCHMRDHEDMGMMRPFVVMPAEVMKIEQQHGHPMPPGHGH